MSHHPAIGRRLWVGLAGVVLAVAGCDAAPPPSATSSEAAASTSGSPTTTTAEPSESGAALFPQPGQPYDAAALLAAMRDSRRPGGVPDAIATPEVADALAELLWTIDGAPPDATATSGTCGSAACELEVVATRADAEGEDLWRLHVDPATGGVEVAGAELGAVPVELSERLDRMTRAADATGRLYGLLLTTTRWNAPPDADRFALAYRGGEEEGSCELDLVLDARSGQIEVVRERDC